jgi:phosphoglucosamine mutase
MALFGTDGVRGHAGSFMDPFMVVKLAMAAGIYYRRTSRTKKIMVGKDTRRSGYMIENALVSGFTAVGYNVVQIGPMPTPAVAFLTESMRCDGGIMISASHNPFDDNGIKFFDHNGYKLPVEAEREIEEIYHNQALLDENVQVGKNIGSSKRIDDVIGRYIVKIKDSFPTSLDLSGRRIVLDTANGAAYKVGPTVFEELGADVIVVNSEPNGSNINEDCGAMHPRNLGNQVLKYRADIGFAMDGDADRLVVVDEKGETIDGDKLLGALAIHLKKENKLTNDGCVATKMSNGALDEYLGKYGVKLFRSDIGDKYVAEVMQQEKLVFGGEQSGHVIFGNYAKTGDGLVSALQTMAFVIESGKSASVALNPFELYPQLQTAIMIVKKIPFEEYEGLKTLLEKIEQAGIRHLIRYSGTENKLRVLLEGKNKKALKAYFDEVVELLKSQNA